MVHEDVDKVLIEESVLAARVQAMAADIAAVYANAESGIVIVSILAGSLVFLADLIRHLPIRLKMGLVTVSSYSGPATVSRGAKLEWAFLPELCNRDVLIVDDIIETGGTLRLVQEKVASAKPRSVRSAVLLRKPDKAPPDLAVDFVGFDVGNMFVVGYGLDFDGMYRNLPYVAQLKPHLYGPNVTP